MKTIKLAFDNLVNILDKIKTSLYLKVMIWAGARLFKYVDIHTLEGEDNVTSITFSNDEQYIEKISEM